MSTVAPSQPSRDEARAHASAACSKRRALSPRPTFSPVAFISSSARDGRVPHDPQRRELRELARRRPGRAAPAEDVEAHAIARPRSASPWTLVVERTQAQPAAARVPLHDPALLRAVEPRRVEHDQVLAQPRAQVEALRRVDVVREQRALGTDVDQQQLADVLLDHAAERRGQLLGDDRRALRGGGLCGAPREQQRDEVRLGEVRPIRRRDLELADPRTCRGRGRPSRSPRSARSRSGRAPGCPPGSRSARPGPAGSRRSPRRIRISPPSSRLTWPTADGWASVPGAVNSPTTSSCARLLRIRNGSASRTRTESGRLSPTDSLPCSACELPLQPVQGLLLLVEIRRVVGLCQARASPLMPIRARLPAQAQRRRRAPAEALRVADQDPLGVEAQLRRAEQPRAEASSRRSARAGRRRRPRSRPPSRGRRAGAPRP